MAKTTESAALADEFRELGYVVLPGVFADAELTAVREEAQRILDFVLDTSLAARRRNPRLDCVVRDDGTVVVRKVQPVNDLSELIASISSDPRLIGPMTQLMGDTPVLMEEKLNYKQVVSRPGDDFSFITRPFPVGFPLHHDWGYYRQQGYPENTISSAVALDDCAGRGPLRVIPGSHLIDAAMKNPDPSSGDGEVVEGFMVDVERTPINAPAGSVMLFHAKLLHDSEPNPSGLPRRLMIYSHYPASHDDGGGADRRNGPIREYAQDFERRALEV